MKTVTLKCSSKREWEKWSSYTLYVKEEDGDTAIGPSYSLLHSKAAIVLTVDDNTT